MKGIEMGPDRRKDDSRLDSMETKIDALYNAMVGSLDGKKKGFLQRLGLAELKIRFILWIFSGVFTTVLLRYAYVQIITKA